MSKIIGQTVSTTYNPKIIKADLDDYTRLENLPTINGFTVIGEKKLEDYGILIPTKISALDNDTGYLTAVSANIVSYKDDKTVEQSLDEIYESITFYELGEN